MAAATTAIRPVVLTPVAADDPRLTLDHGALVEASRNAYPVVARSSRGGDRIEMFAGGAVALALGAATFIGLNAARQPAQRMPAAAPPAAAAPVSPIAATPPTPAPSPAAAVAPVASPAPLPVVGSSAQPVSLADLQGRRWSSPTMVFDASAPVAGPGAPALPTATGGSAPEAAGGENEQFASRLSGGREAAAVATAMADPASTVSQGTLIPAVLETAIDTDLPGYVRAVVSRDIRAFDNSRVLIPRSSRLIGQYKSGLAAGQTRAYVIWTRLIRPDGASVALASPAIEFSGRSGLGGEIDNHFMKRFGSAMLLSVVGGLGALTSGGASLIMGGGQSAASVAAGRDGAIPPTIRVRQGEPIRVFTARDLDFSKVSGG